MTDKKIKVIAPEGQQYLTVEREFDAPKELVYKAHIEREFLEKWWGMGTTKIDKLEAKAGGSWRFVEGSDAFHGVYHQVSPEDGIVWTFEYEGMPGHVLMETMKFEEVDGGKTKVVSTSVFQSLADRDGMLQSGMEEGAGASYDKLEKVLQEMQK